MSKSTAQQAIKAALSGNWEEAIKLNKEILSKNPKDTDALNRMARAFAEKGDVKKARLHAKKVLDIDPLNSIAKKSLSKWEKLENGETKKSDTPKPNAFLEEPGKTKIVKLMHLGDTKVVASLDSGDKLELKTNNRRISVTTSDGDYIGRIADDLSAKLKELIKHGNEYQVLVKSVHTNDKADVQIFIRETKRAEKLSDIPSFTDKIDFISFTSTGD